MCSNLLKQFDYTSFEAVPISQVQLAVQLPSDCSQLCPSSGPLPPPKHSFSDGPSWLVFGLVVGGAVGLSFVLGYLCHSKRARKSVDESVDQSLMDVMEY